MCAFSRNFYVNKLLKNEYINLLFIFEAKYFMNYNCTKLYLLILYTYILFREISEFRKASIVLLMNRIPNQN